MKAPWEFSTPSEGGVSVPNLPTQAGAELGVELARLAEKELEVARRQFPRSPTTCDECAFVKGTEPNRSPATLMDAIKCVVEGEPFYCHKGVVDEPKRLCAGWVAVVGARDRLACAVANAGSRDGLMSRVCDHGSEFEWAPVAGSWRIDRKSGCRCWWPEPLNPEIDS